MTQWHDLGTAENLKTPSLREIKIGSLRIALSFVNDEFKAIGGSCSHVGGPLGEGHLEGEDIVCPWHYFRHNRETGVCRLGKTLEISVPRYELKTVDGHLFINLDSLTEGKLLHEYQDALTRPLVRAPGPIRIAGISTTAMTPSHPRYSTSEALLETALDHAKEELGAETKLLRLNDLKIRNCEGYYSKSKEACLWPCSITRADKTDQMEQVYEAMVHWADIILVATPIRWGSASSLYYKMVERMNAVQNQITLHNNVLIRNKVASFIITGGQDNVQLVAGQMMGFFGEIGFVFPPFPYIAHTLGWNNENMERNVKYVKKSEFLHKGAKELVRRAHEMSQNILANSVCKATVERAGRKASPNEE